MKNQIFINYNQYTNNNEFYYNLRGNYNINKDYINNNNQNYLFYNDNILNNNKLLMNNVDKMTYLKHLIAKNLDKLNDDDMLGLIQYIQEIMPDAILDKPEDLIEIDTTKFLEETYLKLIKYLKEIFLKKM